MKGFMAFVLGAILLLAFVSAAAKLSGAQPGYSYKTFHAFGLQETAMKQSFYSAASDAASAALASQAGEFPDPIRVQSAIHARAVLFEAELQSAGFDALFWCGSPTEGERTAAAEGMMKNKRAILPYGTVAISPLSCADSFLVDLDSGKIHFRNFGFSFYSSGLGIGRAASFPSSYEVEFL